MPPLERKSPKSDFFERGRQLFRDAENSGDPELARLRIEAGKRYFELDAKGGARVSPRRALTVGVIVLLILVGICVYVDVKLSGIVVMSVLLTCLLFALLIIVMLLALCGVMKDTAVAELISGMYDKTLGKLVKINADGND
jgi:hypothetical protein